MRERGSGAGDQNGGDRRSGVGRFGVPLAGFDGEWLLLPNLVTYLRGLLLPIFVVLLVHGSYGWALVTLAVLGLTDWLDGLLARRLGLESRLGLCLDPLFDRVGVIVIVISCAAVGLTSWWLVAVLAAPELVLACIVLTRPGTLRILRPTRIGKVRTALLSIGFPLLILAAPQLLGSATLTVMATTLLEIGALGHLFAGAQYGRALLGAGDRGRADGTTA